MVSYRDIEAIKTVRMAPPKEGFELEILYERAGISQEVRLQALWDLMVRGDDTKSKTLELRMRELDGTG